MSSIKGLDNLLKKLDSLTDLDTSSIVEDCADKAVEIVRNKAQEFSDEEYMCIDKSPIKTYRSNSAAVDVGLLDTNHDFEEYKGLWFNNYGFTLWKNGKFYAPHVGWFDEAKEEVAKEVMKEMKTKLKQEINEKLR